MAIQAVPWAYFAHVSSISHIIGQAGEEFSLTKKQKVIKR
jgi:hypothetical protein